MPVAHTFDLTHSPYGSLVHQQKTCTKLTRLFFCRFFLAQKKQATAHSPRHKRHQPTRSEGGSKTQNNTPTNTPIYTWGGGRQGIAPTRCGCAWGLVVCRCCALFGVGVDRLIMSQVCQIYGVAFGKYPARQVCEGSRSFAGRCRRLRAVDQGLRVVSAICRLVRWWLLFVVVQRRAHRLRVAGGLGASGLRWGLVCYWC